MKRLIFCLLALLTLPAGSVLAGPKVSKLTPTVPGVIYIQFKANAPHLAGAVAGDAVVNIVGDRSHYESILHSLGAYRISPFDAATLDDSIAIATGVSRIFVINYANEIDPLEAADLFLGCSEISACSPRYLFPILKTPNDPQVPNQYALTKMDLFGAWDITTGDTNVVIADVDLGCNYNHEDLAASIKYNLGEVGVDSKGKDKRTNKVDDDKDGVVDNWLGVNIVGNGTDQNFQPTGDPLPGNAGANHGTITAGLIAARADNNLGIAGTGYNCKLMAIRADDGTGNVAGGYEGIHYAVVHGARVVNCSWGGPIDLKTTGILESVIQEATAHNALVVAAVGNSTNNIDSVSFSPAVLPGVLAVGATDENDQPASFSNFGHRVDVYAPGVNVLSTNWPGNNAYTSANGTSFASPEVAGIVGLMMSKHPDWPLKFITQQIINTCDNVVRPSDRFHFWGRVNAARALGTPTLPGLAVQSYTANGVKNGLIDTVGTVTNLSVVFKNYIGNGQNIVATLLTIGGVSVDLAQQQIGSLNTGEVRQLNYTLRRNAQFSNGSLPLYFAVTDGASYTDTLLLLVPMKSQQGYVFVDSLDGYCTSVKQVSADIAWVTNGFDNGTNFLSYFEVESGFSWNSAQQANTQTTAPWCVEAVDDAIAWFGTASRNGRLHANVLNTPDQGATWNTVDVAAITPYINSIHFTSPMNGMFIGDPRSGNWGIGVTNDGGATWKANSLTSSALAGELGWKNSISWVRRNGWFGTNKGDIYRSTDGGARWKASQVSAINVVGVGFDDDSLHGIAVCKPAAKTLLATVTGTSAIFRSSDGGATWVAATLPSVTTVPSDVKFVPGIHVAYLTTNNGVYRSTDFGATWNAAGVPASWSGADATISIASNTTQYVATAASMTGTISLTGPMPPIEAVALPAQTGSIELLQNRPNPATLKTSISFSTTHAEHIKLTLYDALGRQIIMLLDQNVEPGMHSISLATSGLVSGAYEYVLETASGVRLARKLTIVN